MAGIADYLVWYAKDKDQVKYHQLYSNEGGGRVTMNIATLIGSTVRSLVSGVHSSTIKYATSVRDLPHSKQVGFNRDVINPHDG
jgi:hypothetical protein